MKTYFKLFWIFFKIGIVTIGGGLVMLPLIEREIADKQGWATHEEMVDIFALAQTLPGVIAINSSISIGYKVAGIAGSIFGVIGVAVPSLVAILAVALLLPSFADNIYVQKAFMGVRIGMSGMLLVTAWNMGKRIIKDYISAILLIAAFLFVVFCKLSTIYIIIAGAIVGFCYYNWSKK